jgi:Cobalamin adenosyltransferase
MAGERRDNPVVLSRIYTKTGDDGTTALVDGSRVSKTDCRLQAYADTDETNCAIGVAVTFGQLVPAMNDLLSRIQNELFDVGADLANPVSRPGRPRRPAPVPVPPPVTIARCPSRLNRDMAVTTRAASAGRTGTGRWHS